LGLKREDRPAAFAGRSEFRFSSLFRCWDTARAYPAEYPIPTRALSRLRRLVRPKRNPRNRPQNSLIPSGENSVTRYTVQSKLKTYSDTERDLLRFLLQRGETDGQTIRGASQEGYESCERALNRLTREGLVQMRESAENRKRFGYWQINPLLADLLRDLLYPREESQATPRFIV
jgi:hypothetical protein